MLTQLDKNNPTLNNRFVTVTTKTRQSKPHLTHHISLNVLLWEVVSPYKPKTEGPFFVGRTLHLTLFHLYLQNLENASSIRNLRYAVLEG